MGGEGRDSLRIKKGNLNTSNNAMHHDCGNARTMDSEDSDGRDRASRITLMHMMSMSNE